MDFFIEYIYEVSEDDYGCRLSKKRTDKENTRLFFGKNIKWITDKGFSYMNILIYTWLF
ncbi:hypothetical protein ALC62_13176 [Cyphomyrmex costatus]|uniref:Uncharacterized protein n=1 Tax=Cyphomyrmex costatus TaxID=456900 RepID=A0A195C666_9HYME|nr:hypothetical protein ALC62_13176 [Cyphomyrmex costatus]